MKKLNVLIYAVLGFLAGLLLGFMLWGMAKTVKAWAQPAIRLTSMCKENENTGLMRFREETSGDAHITWMAKISGGSYFQSGEIKLGETVFFDAPLGTVIVDWYMTEDTAITGSTVKAQNNTACTYITICQDGVTQDNWIENKGIPEGATRGECVEEEETPEVVVETPLTQAGAPICPDGSILDLPIAFKVVRQGDIATLTWYKTGGNLVNIYYKEVSAKDWTHAVGDVPNVDPSNKYVIGGLKPALGYTFAIEQHNGCAGGQLAQSVVIDGPAYLPVVFNFSYWQWSK